LKTSFGGFDGSAKYGSPQMDRIPFRTILESAVSIYKRMYFSFCVPEQQHALQDSRSLAASISQRPLASHERMLQQICDEIADAIHLVKLQLGNIRLTAAVTKFVILR
jgi:hypothetical protein